MEIPADIVDKLGLKEFVSARTGLDCLSPIDGSLLGRVPEDDEKTLHEKIGRAEKAFLSWRSVPAPKRGALIAALGNELRNNKEALGTLVSLECGKIVQEGLGEVQEMIDICDFAVGLSRQLYGLTIASERPGHRMSETWHPLGPVGIITAFNFPVAVWSWNAAIALVCGDSLVWKPSEKSPLTAMACAHLLARAAEAVGDVPDGLMEIAIGGREIGEALAGDTRLPLISATGSTRMGRSVAPRVAGRFGRSLLELGGNNAIIVAPSADLELARRAILFGAVGTAGQRCTTTRRLFVHEKIYDALMGDLNDDYANAVVGNPLNDETLVGPLIDEAAYAAMQDALAEAREAGAAVSGGERLLANEYPQAWYVRPAIVEARGVMDNHAEEVFAPVLYVFDYAQFDEALARQNNVPQGLSSALFTNDFGESERYLSATGSDCGIANVNIGTSGAEIGGAFGGEKETGGGRESGSDAWKSYMRRQTSTVNYSGDMPLAQGIKFGGD